MRILILNRRDIANPQGGGAEIYTHEIARRLAADYQCDVTVFASRFPGSMPEDAIDGVRYIRRGNEASVHLHGLFYAVKNRKKFDRIIDEFNGIGFFTFFLPNSVLLIHQLYKEFWFRELGFIGVAPYVLEPLLLKLYRKGKTVTVSRSTREDLDQLGFRNIAIVMNAITHVPGSAVFEKEAVPTLVFLGRLRGTKRPEDAIAIFRRVKERVPAAKLWMIGRGPSEEKIKALSEGLDGITFWGWVSAEKKMSLLARAHILLVPSVREGFGINVIEAASAGTPAIGYDVHGLRDSIRHGETGYLVNSIDEATSRIVELLGNKEEYEEMTNNCLNYARGFDWSKRALEFWQALDLAHP